jgi:membrane protease YdiL (CAAX protease family)
MRWVARHPVAAFLVMAYAFSIAVVLPPLQTPPGSLPSGLSLSDSLGTIFGVALSAFLVMAAMHGRAGMQDLARRSLRWRVGLRWYLFALFGLPVATLLCASVIYRLAPLNALLDNWPLLFTVVLPQFLLRIVLFNLPEEIGFTGFLQDRLQDRYGPLKACVMVELPFALWHLPSFIVDTGLGFAQWPLFLVYFGLLVIGQFFSRIIIMWLYNSARRSVLLVGLFHASFNVTAGALGREFIPGWSEGSALLIATGLVVVTAVLLVILTRGRLAYRPDHGSQMAGIPITA